MATTEIEKLERRYAENPQGLTFAPLAEVHRKNGDVARALELLRAGLELHPNYIPASIVLGRCHWDLGELPAAEAAFAHVLRLDDENVIALKALADINERLERFGEAQRWLNRLISIDRSNEEARQQLARLESAKAQPERKASATEPASPAEVPHEIAAAGPEPVPDAQAEPAAPAASASDRVEPVPPDLTLALSEAEAPPAAVEESKAATLEFLDTSEPLQKEKAPVEEPAAVAGLISQEFVPPKDTSFPLHPELSQEVARPDDTFERLEVETAEEVELQSSGASEFRVPNAAEDFLDFSAAQPQVSDLKPATEVGRPRPEEAARPTSRVAEPPVGQPEKPTKPSYSARDTRGQSVASFFAALLAARLPGTSNASSAPQSSRDGAAPPSKESPVPVANASLEAEVSFDEFFGAAPGRSSPVPQANPDTGKDDLDQFQTWLQNLKR
jgi:tetratricopeptide (TPR) repeat protein